MKNITHMSRILPVLFILTFVLGWAHYFIFLSITRSIDENIFLKNGLAALLTLGLLLIPTGFLLTMTGFKKKTQWLSWLGYTWMGFFNLLFFSSLFEFFVALFTAHAYSYWTFYFSVVIGIWALYNGLRKPRIVTHEMKAPAAMAGLTLVQISDLHVGMLHLNARWLSHIVDAVNSLQADIFAITGDLVEGPYNEVSPMLQVLEKALAKTEKFYITGNHEYIHGSGPWEKRLHELGYTVLHNENKIIRYNEAQILFAGVPDRMVTRFDHSLKSLPDLALLTKEKVDYKILLAHEPASRWDMKTETCDLILSGHTHGGQIFPFGLLVRLAQPVVTGFKQMGEVLVFAHQGTGFWGPPMRWFSRSEIVLFKFVK